MGHFSPRTPHGDGEADTVAAALLRVSCLPAPFPGFTQVSTLRNSRINPTTTKFRQDPITCTRDNAAWAALLSF
jgi:hypothetical protein